MSDVEAGESLATPSLAEGAETLCACDGDGEAVTMGASELARTDDGGGDGCDGASDICAADTTGDEAEALAAGALVELGDTAAAAAAA
jgi:hypothetical protein